MEPGEQTVGRKVVRQVDAVFRQADGTEFEFICMTAAMESSVGYLTHCLFRSAAGQPVPIGIRRAAFLDLSALGRHQDSPERSEQMALEELARRTGGELVATVREYRVELDRGGDSRAVVSLRKENGPRSWRGWVSGPLHYTELLPGETPRPGMLEAVPPGERTEAEESAIRLLDAGLVRYGARRTDRPV